MRGWVSHRRGSRACPSCQTPCSCTTAPACLSSAAPPAPARAPHSPPPATTNTPRLSVSSAFERRSFRSEHRSRNRQPYQSLCVVGRASQEGQGQAHDRPENQPSQVSAVGWASPCGPPPAGCTRWRRCACRSRGRRRRRGGRRSRPPRERSSRHRFPPATAAETSAELFVLARVSEATKTRHPLGCCKRI
eukprot:COSAG04_NODE_2040_length_4948_cov_1.674572_3_plen_191_part_00